MQGKGKTGRRAAPEPQGRPAMWAKIRELRSFTIPEVAAGSGVGKKTAADYVKALLKGGYVERQEERRPRPTIYRLINDIGTEAPRLRRDGTPFAMGRSQENLWRTMRFGGSFTPAALAIEASTEETPVSPVAAAAYCRYLAAAGYLLVGSGSGADRSYTFIQARNTGPKPPQVQKVRQVWDPNVGKVMWTREAPHG